MSELKYNIYKLNNYFNTTEFFEKDLEENKDAKFQGTIAQVVEKLKKNEGWHIRINPQKSCLFYVDFDKTTKERFVKLLKLLCKDLELKPEEISYTKSKTIDGKYSYHISIPSIWTNPQNIRRYFENTDCYKEFLATKEIDISVYSVKPYRLPMQTNEEKTIPHKIIQGKLEDFITEYTSKAEYKLEDEPEKVYVNNHSDEEVNEEDVHKCLECIDPDCGYEDWIKVATAVKNLTCDFDIWNDWSKQSSKYNAKEMKTKWKSFNNTDIGIACLKSLARQFNEELYLENFPKPEVNVEFIDDEEEPEPEPEPETQPKAKPVKENNSFAYMSQEFEKTHCLIINTSLYLKETDKGVIFFTKGKLKDSYEHLVCSDKVSKDGKPELFIDAWMTGNKNKRRYDDCEVYPRPLVAPKNIYNLWTPFECEKYTTPYTKNDEALQLLLNHIKILCNNEEAIADYFIKWIGQMIQYPSVKTICPVIISKQGAGKGTLMRLLEKMMGQEKCIETTDPCRDIWGQFNGLMTNAFFVNLNELSKNDTKEVEGKFKGLVTDPHIYINNKGKGQFKIKSYHRFLITTNNEDPIKTSPDDRRNLIIRASDEVCGNKAYFSKLYKLLDDVNVIRTCYDYFNSIPNLANFHEIDTPKTEHQTNLAKLSLTPPEQFLIDICSKKEGIVEILSKDLYDQFMSFTIDHNIEYSTTPLKFAVKLANLKISGFEKGKHTKKGDFKNIDIDKVRKHFKLGFVDDN